MMMPMDPYQFWLRDSDKEDKEKEKKEKEPKSKLEEKFLETRTILLFGEISQKSAREVCEKLILLSSLNDDDIKLIINSQGGHVEAGDTIHDMLTFVKPRVKILGTGWVASAGALIYVSVPVQDRYSLPNTRFMLHQPSGGVGGPAPPHTQ
jgi:ATP-dependent Clp protease protease subunit